MAGNMTIRVSRQPALLCVLLALSLCAPRPGAQVAAHHPEQPAQIQALANAPSTIALPRVGERLNGEKHRSPGTPFVLVPPRGPISDDGRSLTPAEEVSQHHRWVVNKPTGRSPPIAIS
jgi:hypothetical protein